MKKLAVMILMLASPVMAGDDNQFQWNDSYVWKDQNLIANMKPSRILSIRGADDRTATIDFSGDHVAYRGDLPVDEAAKVFFESVMAYTQAKDCPKAEGR